MRGWGSGSEWGGEFTMRRTDKEIVSRAEIDDIIRGSLVCHVAMIADGEPYVVPLSFGYDGGAIYLHTAREGRKIACFEQAPSVAFCFERGVEIREHPESACRWTTAYESVVGRGIVRELTAAPDVRRAFGVIMRHYSGRDGWEFDPATTARTRCWRIDIESLTGKRSPAGASAKG